MPDVKDRVGYETWIPSSKAGRLRWLDALLKYGGKFDAAHMVSFGPKSNITTLIYLQPKHVKLFENDVGTGVKLKYISPCKESHGSLRAIYKTDEEELNAREHC